MLMIQLLNKKIHNLKKFNCGHPVLNTYLSQQAALANKRSLAKIYVLVDTVKPEEIIAYYTLCFASVKAPANSKLERYPHPVPIVKLARMAVSLKYQGRRFGEQLLLDAIRKTACSVMNETPGAVVGLSVDAKHGAEAFYSSYGFIELERGNPQSLWLPIKSCIELCSS